MNIKKLASAGLAVITAFSLCACSKSNSDLPDYADIGKKSYYDKAYDYKLDKYITLGEYKGVKYTPASEEVTDSDIENAVKSAMSSAGLSSSADVTDRPAQMGDTVNIDFEGLLDGVAFQGGTASNYLLELGSGKFIAGFEEGLVGVSVGETVALNLKFPENYGKQDLNGKDVVFNVTVNSITETIYPELTNENVKEISEYDTVDAYKEYLKTALAESKKTEAQNSKINDCWKTVVSAAQVSSYPEDEFQRYYNQIVTTYTSYAQSYNAQFSDFLSQYLGMTEDQFYAEAKNTAEQGVKEEMVAIAVARAEKLEFTGEEFVAKCEEFAEQRGYESAEALVEQVGLDKVIAVAYIEKVQSFIADNAVAQ